jgi:hypothetical protein
MCGGTAAHRWDCHATRWLYLGGGSSEIENSMVFRLFIAGAMSRWHRNNVLLRPVTGSVVVRRWQVACVVWWSSAVPADDMWDQGGLS